MTLTDEQIRAMKSGEAIRMHLEGEETEFVMLRADVFDSLRDVADDEFQPSEAYAAFAAVAGPAGWDDPEMDEVAEAGAKS